MCYVRYPSVFIELSCGTFEQLLLLILLFFYLRAYILSLNQTIFSIIHLCMRNSYIFLHNSCKMSSTYLSFPCLKYLLCKRKTGYILFYILIFSKEFYLSSLIKTSCENELRKSASLEFKYAAP